MTRLRSLISASRFIVEGSRWLFALALGGAVIAGLFPALGVLALQGVVEAASNGRVAWGGLGLLAVSMLAHSIVSRVADLAANEAARRAVARARRTFISRLATVTDLAQYDNPAFHDRVEAARSALDVGVGQYPNHLVNVVTSLTTVTAIAATLVRFDPLVAVLAVLVIIPAWISDRYIAQRQVAFVAQISASERERAMIEDASRRLSVAIEGFVYQGWVALRRRYGAATDRANRHELQANLAVFWAELARAAAVGALFFAAATIAMASISTESLTPRAGAAAAALAGLTVVFSATQNWSGALANLFEAALRWQMFEAAFESPKPADSRLEPPLFDSTGSPRSWPAPTRIAFQDVWFRYDDDGAWVVKDINLELQFGDLVSLVGQNGAGKSTIVRLLCGFLTPTRGRVTWDGVDLAGNAGPLLWRHINLVMQDFPTYEYTLSENVVLGRDDLSEDDVRSVLDIVGLSEVVAGAPAGLDTMVSMLVWGDEDSEAAGIELSGGQWQRLALARAMIERRGVTVADEPNSALDPTAELHILAALRDHATAGIGLIVSHRLTSLRPDDRVVLIENGCIAGDGQHQDLWATNDAYKGFFGGQVSALASLDTWSD